MNAAHVDHIRTCIHLKPNATHAQCTSSITCIQQTVKDKPSELSIWHVHSRLRFNRLVIKNPQHQSNLLVVAEKYVTGVTKGFKSASGHIAIICCLTYFHTMHINEKFSKATSRKNL